MVLKLLDKAYWILGIILFLIFSVGVENVEDLYVYLTSFVVFVTFGLTLNLFHSKDTKYYTGGNLFWVVSLYSLVYVYLFQQLSWYLTGNYFVFYVLDAESYLAHSLHVKNFDYAQAIEWLSKRWASDDWGAFMWMTTIFKIHPSQLALAIAHSFIGGFTALCLFYIGRSIMPRKYAFYAALLYSISSYVIVFRSQTLKETIMTFVVVMPIYLLYRYLNTKHILWIILAYLTALLIFFFRIPVAMIVLFVLSWALLPKLDKTSYIILGVVLLAVLLSSAIFDHFFQLYLYGGDMEMLASRQDRYQRGSGGILERMADPIAAMIGPFPSFIMSNNKATALYNSGLLYRILLAFPFFLGAYWVVKHQFLRVMPLVILFLITAFGVAVSVKGLGVRLSIPHLPFMYLVALWAIYIIDTKKQKDARIKRLLSLSIAGVCILCIMWSFRYSL